MVIQGVTNNQYTILLNSNRNQKKEVQKKEDVKEETTIQKNNDFPSKWDEVEAILEKHYQKENLINKTFSDPERHINDKYRNKESKYYRWDMTEEERNIARIYEDQMLSQGKIRGCDMLDYELREFGRFNAFEESEKEIEYKREAVSRQMKQLLEENHITIPKEKNLTFIINPYDYSVQISGLDNEDLEKQIQELLEQGENSKNLYHHLRRIATYTDSSQCTREKREKDSLFWEIKNTTGYDLRNLRNENGRFYTEDGKDILDLYRNSSLLPAAYRQDAIDFTVPLLKKYGASGFQAGEDLTMSVGYKNGDFYDIG